MASISKKAAMAKAAKREAVRVASYREKVLVEQHPELQALVNQRTALAAEDSTNDSTTNAAKIAQITAQINAAPVDIADIQRRLVTESYIDSDGDKTPSTAVVAFKKEVAQGVIDDPKSTPSQVWAARQIANPSMLGEDDGAILQAAEAHAYQNTPQWQAAVTAYNTGQPVPEAFVPLLNRMNGYFGLGEAAPGALQPEIARPALTQWEVDAQPGGLEKFMESAIPLIIGGALLAIGIPAVFGTAGTAGTVAGATAADMGLMSAAAMTPEAYAAATAAGFGTAGTAASVGLGTLAGGTVGAPTAAATLTDTVVSGALNPATAGNVGLVSGLETTAAGVTSGAIEAGVVAAGNVPLGGIFVGTNGILGSTGNAIVDGAANSALGNATQNAVVAAVTGEDVGDAITRGVLGGAATGAFGGFTRGRGELFGRSTLGRSADSALNRSVGSGIYAAATGGDISDAMTVGAITGGAGPLITEGVNQFADFADIDSDSFRTRRFLTDAATGAVGGGANAIVTGENVLDSMGTGALTGLGGSLASEAVDFLFDTDAGGVVDTLATTAGRVVGHEVGDEVFNTGVTPTDHSTTDIIYNAPAAPAPGTMSRIGSIINPNYQGGLIDNYQSLAVQRANQART